MGLVMGGKGLVVLGWWRHKVSLTRILDGTETKIGDPPPVRGVDAGVVYAAFMIHPLTLDDVWQAPSLRPLKPWAARGLLPEPLIRLSLRWLRPQLRGDIRGIRWSWPLSNCASWVVGTASWRKTWPIFGAPR